MWERNRQVKALYHDFVYKFCFEFQPVKKPEPKGSYSQIYWAQGTQVITSISASCDEDNDLIDFVSNLQSDIGFSC